MCGRFVLITDLNDIQADFRLQEVHGSFSPNRNITPGQQVCAVIRQAEKNILVLLKWGLVPSWAKDPSTGRRMFNARAETIDQKPSFKNAFQKRRCLIISDGFYEWKQEGAKKIPYYFNLKSGKPFGFAGLYETWTAPDGKQLHTCAIITTAPNELILPIHDRMPVIFPKDQEQEWIDNERYDREGLLSLLRPYPAEDMDCQAGMGPVK